MVGKTVAQYRIEDELGQGGMGVVYRAWDTRLHRAVALKFLSAQLASDQDALQRLQREARAASGLNHPNICTVYDLVEDGDSWFIAMEMLEGETLQQRLARRPLNIAEIVDWSISLADALQVAHSRGIIHRDLKPSNIFITDRGLVKIVDFGLAKKVLHPTNGNAATALTLDEDLTLAGSTMGTLGYMSPEQARGLEADGRTDLFSLGAVLYEMVAGRRAFPGETPAVIFDAILNNEPPPPSRMNSKCPPALDQIIAKALEKDREVRYQSAADLQADLKRLKRSSETGVKIAPEAPTQGRKRPILLLGVAVGMAAILLIVAAMFFTRKNMGPVSPGEWVALTRFSDSAVQPAVSRDGRLLAFLRSDNTFLGAGQIYVKVLPDGEPVALTHDDTMKMSVAFSADASLISYGVCCGSWDTWIVPVFGGNPRPLFANATGLNWIDNNHLLFSEIKQGVHMGLVTSSKQRSDVRDVYLPAHERAMVHISALSPDGKWVLLVEMGGDGGWLPCRVVPFDGSSGFRQVGPNAPCLTVAWSPGGRWMYFSAETGDRFHIWRQKFPDGSPEQVTSGPTEEAGIAFAPDGKSFVTSVGTTDSSVWIHDHSGDRQISQEEHAFAPRFSPDGSKVYYLVHRTDAKGSTLNELWSSDPEGHGQPVLPGVSVEDPGFAPGFALLPDRRHVVYVHAAPQSNGKRRSRLWIARTDNGSSAQEIKSDVEESEVAVTQDGTIYFRATEDGKNHLYRRKSDGSGRELVLPESIIELFSVSPDGAWAAVMVESNDHDAPPLTKLYSLHDGRPPPFVPFAPPHGPGTANAFIFLPGADTRTRTFTTLQLRRL